ncbi:MAG TPA: CNNM domain-containing protein [Bacteroidia bacterium]|nr:CNNM domain-containing protein [Bacteroidia bacterium]
MCATLLLQSTAVLESDPVASATQPSWLVPVLLLGLLSVGAVAVSFACSLTEATLLSLNPLWLKSRDPRTMPTARQWLDLKQRIERPVSAILVVNTLANTGLPTLAGAVFLGLCGTDWLWAFSLSMSVTMLVFGELMPKILGVRRANALAPRLLGPLRLTMGLFGPVAALAQRASGLLSPKHGEEKQDSPVMDIITLTQAAKAENAIHGREEMIIIHAATLSARRVSASMTPADSVKVFDLRLGLRENLSAFGDFIPRACPVSRDGSLEHAAGYVRLRELLAEECLATEPTDWRRRIRPVPAVSGRDSLTHLLAVFLEGDSVAALVRDNDGASVGWITMDDVTRILMGE